MKRTILLMGALGLLAAGSLSAAAAPRAEVIFDHPENFTDAKDQFTPTDKGRDAILKALREFIVREAGYQVPAGYQLMLTFTDVDLAGDFEPWRGPDFDEIRIVREIYPPEFKFTYVLTDPAGRLVKQGRADLRDPAFQMRSTLDDQDPLRYEKSMLSDWLRTSLRGAKTAGG
jgi:Protein of unknown function (DUF3016)